MGQLSTTLYSGQDFLSLPPYTQNTIICKCIDWNFFPYNDHLYAMAILSRHGLKR